MGRTTASIDGNYWFWQLLREGVLGGLLKLVGVNSNQLGVIALNVLIIVAEWVRILPIFMQKQSISMIFQASLNSIGE